MRVLVIDDHEDSAFLLCELAKVCGCESRSCTIATIAVETVRGWQPHVILLDLAMPGIDGYQLAPKLRAASDRVLPHILLVSGYVPDRQKLAEGLIDGHLLKPVSLEQLKSLLPC
jgi:CheY-like chemotaxis protein